MGAALLLLMLEAAKARPRFTISLKRSTQNLQACLLVGDGTRDKSKVWMDVRTGVIWHDGSPMTPEDVVWSFTHAGSPKSGNPVFFIWCGINNFKINGNRIIADVVQYNPVLFKWMAFLSAYVLPKAYYEKVGPEGFEKSPVGTGPLFDAYEGNAYLRLKANPNYWGAKHLRSTPSCSNSFRMRPRVLPKSNVAHQM